MLTHTLIVFHTITVEQHFVKLLVIYCLPIRANAIGVRIYILLVQQMYISYII